MVFPGLTLCQYNRFPCYAQTTKFDKKLDLNPIIDLLIYSIYCAITMLYNSFKIHYNGLGYMSKNKLKRIFSTVLLRPVQISANNIRFSLCPPPHTHTHMNHSSHMNQSPLNHNEPPPIPSQQPTAFHLNQLLALNHQNPPLHLNPSPRA